MRLSLYLFFAALGAGVFLPGKIHAHGVEVYDVTGEPGRNAGVVYFMYSTGEPMMYAKVKLYPPSRPDVESLQSITDRNGIFSFIADEEGEWRIDAEDGMGHKGTITVNAVSGAAAPETAALESGGPPVPLALGLITGLSLILNIFSGWHFGAVFVRSRKGGVYAHQ
jgi:nickel transport protein